MPRPYPAADTQFDYKDQPYHGGCDTDGTRLPNTPEPEAERASIDQPPPTDKTVG